MLKIERLKDAKFGNAHMYASVSGYALLDTERGGYWAFSCDRDRYGILTPYIPLGGKRALKSILDHGGFLNYGGMEIVKPF